MKLLNLTAVDLTCAHAVDRDNDIHGVRVTALGGNPTIYVWGTTDQLVDLVTRFAGIVRDLTEAESGVSA